MAVKLPPTTLEYVVARVVAEEDISASTVQVADMLEDAVPAEADWKAPANLTRPNVNTVVARMIIDAGRSEVTRTVWIAIGDHPERVVRRAGTYVVA